MSSYASRLERHLKNQAKQLRSDSNLTHSSALEAAAIDFGFSGWKQAQWHMEHADSKIRALELSFSNDIAGQARALEELQGYPFVFDEQLGIRYLPTDHQQIAAVAKRLVLLRVFREVHAPQNLNRTEKGQLWFRAPMFWEEAVDICQAGPMRIHRLANIISGEANASSSLKTDDRITPDLARATVLQYLHALFSLSVLRYLVEDPRDVIEHPCFKEYTGCVLAALLANGEFSERVRVVLGYAGISSWAHLTSKQIDPDRFYWLGGEEPRHNPPSPGVSMLVGSPNHPRLRKPLNSLPLEDHQRLAAAISLLSRYAPTKGGLHKRLDDFRDTLIGWLAIEAGSQESALEIYAKHPLSLRSIAFLAPAEERQCLVAFEFIRNCIGAGYESCVPRTNLLSKLNQIESAVQHWLDRTRNHWRRTNQQLLMDAVGLVAVDPKDEPLLDAEGEWRRTELMGTSREANLVASIRPHLFLDWKEEDEAEGYVFDEADADTEQSVIEHLSDLTFYRYLGSATTVAKFRKDVEKAFYFRPAHIWFKQQKIG